MRVDDYAGVQSRITRKIDGLDVQMAITAESRERLDLVSRAFGFGGLEEEK